MFKTLDQLEEFVTVNKAPAAAKTMWEDKSLPIEERVKAFSKYGKEEPWIWHPKNEELEEIIEGDPDIMNRYQDYDVCDLILVHCENKCWDENKKCHFGFDEEYNRLCELAFAEGVAKFTYDW